VTDGATPSPEAALEHRIAEALAFIRDLRSRVAESGPADLSGLEPCLRTLYEGAAALPAAQARCLIDALVALERDVAALGEEAWICACVRAMTEPVEATARVAAATQQRY
jgi:hypothetical protein